MPLLTTFQVPVLSGGEVKEKTDVVLRPIWIIILKYATLLFTICFLGSPFLYVVMMIDLSKDFVDEPSAVSAPLHTMSRRIK